MASLLRIWFDIDLRYWRTYFPLESMVSCQVWRLVPRGPRFDIELLVVQTDFETHPSERFRYTRQDMAGTNDGNTVLGRPSACLADCPFVRQLTCCLVEGF
jgi:hypothetical protein